ncbi:MAG: hypothetical protein AAF408_20365 [Pseudomonadota bacterium]
MMSLGTTLGQTFSESPLRSAFLKWQCRVRQTAMRDNFGRPDDGITPALYLPGSAEPMGHIITLINKAPGFSVTPELRHMFAKTNDPAQRRDQAIRFFSATYYQKAKEFSDILTATFPPDSPGATQIRDAGKVRLVFDAYAQVFDLTCKVWRLAPHNTLHQSTMAHNKLFNAGLSPQTEILGFEPDWTNSTSSPEYR